MNSFKQINNQIEPEEKERESKPMTFANRPTSGDQIKIKNSFDLNNLNDKDLEKEISHNQLNKDKNNFWVDKNSKDSSRFTSPNFNNPQTKGNLFFDKMTSKSSSTTSKEFEIKMSKAEEKFKMNFGRAPNIQSGNQISPNTNQPKDTLGNQIRSAGSEETHEIKQTLPSSIPEKSDISTDRYDNDNIQSKLKSFNMKSLFDRPLDTEEKEDPFESIILKQGRGKILKIVNFLKSNIKLFNKPDKESNNKVSFTGKLLENVGRLKTSTKIKSEYILDYPKAANTTDNPNITNTVFQRICSVEKESNISKGTINSSDGILKNVGASNQNNIDNILKVDEGQDLILKSLLESGIVKPHLKGTCFKTFESEYNSIPDSLSRFA